MARCAGDELASQCPCRYQSHRREELWQNTEVEEDLWKAEEGSTHSNDNKKNEEGEEEDNDLYDQRSKNFNNKIDRQLRMQVQEEEEDVDERAEEFINQFYEQLQEEENVDERAEKFINQFHRQLQEEEAEEEEEEGVDERAEEFIKQFYQQLKMQV